MKEKIVKKVISKLIESKKFITMKVLTENKLNLNPEEREKVKKLKAEWSDGRSAVFKSKVRGKFYYVVHTHRSYDYSPSLETACRQFHDHIKDTA